MDRAVAAERMGLGELSRPARQTLGELEDVDLLPKLIELAECREMLRIFDSVSATCRRSAARDSGYSAAEDNGGLASSHAALTAREPGSTRSSFTNAELSKYVLSVAGR